MFKKANEQEEYSYLRKSYKFPKETKWQNDRPKGKKQY